MTDNRDAHTETWRGMVEHVLRHMGYTDSEIDRYGQAPDHKLMGCEFDGNHLSWNCCDEHGTSLHPDHDEVGQLVEIIGVALEAPVVARIKADAVAEVVAAIEALPVLRRWIDDSELIDLADLRAALSAGRTALDTQLAQARAEALREAADLLDRLANGGTAYNSAARQVRALISAEASGEGQ